MHDLRLAVRHLVKTPGFATVAVFTLALAIGVNAAIFALVNAVVLRPVVSLRPQELVTLFNGGRDTPDFRPFSHAEFQLLREARDTFVDVAATVTSPAGVRTDEGVRRMQAFFTSENYFGLLGVQPALGRFFTAEEARPNAGIAVVVSSHHLWQQNGGRPDFVGQTLQINGRAYTVVGVTPKDFNGVLVFSRTDFWMPLGMFGDFAAGVRRDLTAPDGHHLSVIARVAPGLTRAALPARLPVLAERLTALASDGRFGRVLHAEAPSRSAISMQPSGGDRAAAVATGVFLMSGCVLLIACLNLANMMLARGATRSKEFALRLALGAGRWRIVRQLMVEGLLLAVAGGAVGLLLGMWANDLLLHSLRIVMQSAGDSLRLDVTPDTRVLGATFLFCLIATLGFSLVPALKSSRTNLIDELKLHGNAPVASGGFNRFFSLSHCLVMGQIALSLMLLFGAGLFLRGALRAADVAPGFDPTGTLVAEADFALTRLRPDAAQSALFSSLDRITAQPGVQSAAAATFVPFSSRSESRSVRPIESAESSVTALYTAITPGYFGATGIRLVGGRDFSAAEARDPSAAVAIVDEALTRKLFPDSSALGRFIHVAGIDREIVGLCAPHRHNTRRPAMPERIFVPYAGGHDGRTFIVVRQAGQVEAAMSALRAHTSDLPVIQLASLSSMVEKDATVWMARLGAVLFGLFGAIALALAVVGLYGVKEYAVSRRTREIGIRMAIGADARDIFALLLRQGAWQIAVATGVGLLLALGAGRILARLLYDVSPADPLALGLSAGLLSLTALIACYVPARRATRVDPVVALRSE